MTADPGGLQDTCPTCGSIVGVYTSDEGTSSFVPLTPEATAPGWQDRDAIDGGHSDR